MEAQIQQLTSMIRELQAVVCLIIVVLIGLFLKIFSDRY